MKAGHTRWLVFWFSWSLLISAIYWILGPHSYLRIQDTADFNLPYRIAAARDFLTYGITWWQPHFSGGLPSWMLPLADSFLMNGPPYFLLPPWLAYGFVMWLQRFVAAWFTFRLCRDHLGMESGASVFAGLAFSLNRWDVTDWTLFDCLGAPGTPLFLFAFGRFLAIKSQVLALVACSLLGIFVGMVASSALYTVFILAALPIWFLLVGKRSIVQVWPFFLCFIAGAVLAEAPVAWALVVYAPESARSLVAANIPMAWGNTILALAHGFVERDLGSNLGYLVLGIGGLFFSKNNRTLSWRLLGIFLISGLGARLLFLFQNLASNWLPSSRGNLLDFDQFTILASVLLAAAGLHRIRLGLLAGDYPLSDWITPDAARHLHRLVAAGIIIVPLWHWYHLTVNLARRMYMDNYAIHFDNPILKQLAHNARDGEPFRVATVGAHQPTIRSASGDWLYPGMAFSYGLDTADGYYRMHSARLFRFWQLVLAGVLEKDPTIAYRINKWQYLFFPDGFDRHSDTPIDLASLYNLKLLSLFNTRYLISKWPLTHPDLRLIHEPTQELIAQKEWHQLRHRDMIVQTILGKAPQHAIYLYENRAVFPRVFMVGSARIFSDDTHLLSALAQASPEELRQTAFLDASHADVGLENPPPEWHGGEVTYQRVRPDKIRLKTKATFPSLVVLTDVYDPYWRVWVDGKEERIVPVDHLFQGIRLDKGNHEIILDYWPPYRNFFSRSRPEP